MAAYVLSEELEALGEDVMETEPVFAELAEAGPRIAWLVCDKAKTRAGRTVYADCQRMSDKQRVISGYDFAVTFYEPNCAQLTEEGRRRVMIHELLHIGWSPDGKTRIVPHDVEDFEVCIRRWGLRWEQTGLEDK